MRREYEEPAVITHTLYLLVGFALGLVAGLLYAPRSGQEMREQVRRRTSDGLDYLYEQKEKLRDHADRMFSKTREWIGRQSEAVCSTAERLREDPNRKSEV